jgi:hypothetical protein
MVRARPDVDEDKGPEMDDRKPVAVYRPVRGLGYVIIHEPQERSRQEEGDRVMAVPPLDERILYPRIDRIALNIATGISIEFTT